MKMLKLFIFLYFLAGILTYSCKKKNLNKETSISNLKEAKDTATTVIEFEKTNHFFGKIKQGEVVTYYLNFKNVGKNDLFILNAKASCGCTVADYPKEPIPPGKKGKISIQFNSSGKKGMQTYSVLIFSNTEPPSTVITITALVEV